MVMKWCRERKRRLPVHLRPSGDSVGHCWTAKRIERLTQNFIEPRKKLSNYIVPENQIQAVRSFGTFALDRAPYQQISLCVAKLRCRLYKSSRKTVTRTASEEEAARVHHLVDHEHHFRWVMERSETANKRDYIISRSRHRIA